MANFDSVVVCALLANGARNVRECERASTEWSMQRLDVNVEPLASHVKCFRFHFPDANTILSKTPRARPPHPPCSTVHAFLG